jgi:transcriptional/translational regulatory protein YebC/TACO1
LITPILRKFGGAIGPEGSSAFAFDKRGVVIVSAEDQTLDTVMEHAIECGAEDVEEDEGDEGPIFKVSLYTFSRAE